MRDVRRWVPVYCAGLLIALFLLVGRWTPFRLSSPDEEPFAAQPRHWIALALFPLACVYARHRAREGRTERSLRAGWFWWAATLAYMAICSAWAPAWELARIKLYDVLLLLFVLAFLGVLLRGLGCADLTMAVWICFVLSAGALAALVPTVYQSDYYGRAAVLGGGTNTFGRNMGWLIQGCLFLYIKQPKVRLLWASCAVAAGMLVIMSGSRGALLAVALGVATTLLFQKVSVRKRLWQMGVLAGAGVVLWNTPMGERAAEVLRVRVGEQVISNPYAAGRDELYASGWALAVANPVFGAGLAGFPASGLGEYPHNLVVEVACEGGAVGLILLTAGIVTLAARVIRRRSLIEPSLLGAGVVAFCSSQFSGDIYDSRGVFIFAVLISQSVTKAARLAVPETREAVGDGRQGFYEAMTGSGRGVLAG